MRSIIFFYSEIMIGVVRRTGTPVESEYISPGVKCFDARPDSSAAGANG
jgi:hypothetical protein